MSLYNYKRAFMKRSSPGTRIIINNLKRENAFLMKTLNEQAHHHNDHSRIIEKFLSLVPLRPSLQDVKEEDHGCRAELMPEELRNYEDNQSNVSDVSVQRMSLYTKDIEEIKDKLVSISMRCQYLENRAQKTQEEECSADAEASETLVTELQMKLEDAIVKNQQWVEYDQQREAYVKSLLAKISWLEKHVHEVSNARASDRSDFLISEKKKVKKLEQYYEGLMQKASEEFQILTEQTSLTQQALTESQRECRQKQNELKELRQQLQAERSQQYQEIKADVEFWTVESEDLQDSLNRERRKSTMLELQSGHLQKYFLNDYHKAQRQLAKFKRMIEILLQDLHDERENCTYLKQQFEFAQMQTKVEDGGKKTNAGQSSDQPLVLPTLPHPRSPRKSLIEDSYMECPMCHMPYPASQYSELIEHLDYCQN